MEKNVVSKQSDLLREKAGNIDSLMMFTDVIIIILGVVTAYYLGVVSKSLIMPVIAIIVAGVMVYANNVMLSARAEFYKTQAAILDAVNEMKDRQTEV